MRNQVTLLIALVAVLVLGNCATAPTAGGGTSDQGNGAVAAMVHTTGGAPAAGAEVILRRQDFLMDSVGGLGKSTFTARQTRVGADGRFRLDSLDIGEYSIEVNDGLSAAALLRCVITQDMPDVLLPDDTLRAYATITGSAAVSPGSASYIQIYGLDRFVRIDSTGAYVIADLPQGTLKLRIVSTDSTVAPTIVDSVAAVAGSVTHVAYAGWRYSTRVFLNTTASGAYVAEDVARFPLLVRLDAAQFDFMQARDSGQDVRFTTSDGMQLPYEIEDWNASAGSATIWVLVDTVRGNNSSQFIVMHWGNQQAVSQSSGAAVFDTASGWVGVWHLSQSPQADSVYAALDATLNGYDGFTMGGMGRSNLVQGPLGPCLEFDGVDDFVHTDPYRRDVSLGTDDVSVSAWFMSRRDSVNQGIVCIEGSERVRLMTSRLGGTWYGIYSDSTWLDRTGGTTPTTGEWHHITTSYSRAGFCRLFVDGAPVDSLDVSLKRDVALDSLHFSIGQDHYAVPSMFTGMIDEARVMKRAVTAEWVRLSFENQRAGSRLVSIQ